MGLQLPHGRLGGAGRQVGLTSASGGLDARRAATLLRSTPWLAAERSIAHADVGVHAFLDQLGLVLLMVVKGLQELRNRLTDRAEIRNGRKRNGLRQSFHRCMRTSKRLRRGLELRLERPGSLLKLGMLSPQF